MRIKKLLIFLIISSILMGCVIGFRHPLNTLEQGIADERIVGFWKIIGDEKGVLSITKKDKDSKYAAIFMVDEQNYIFDFFISKVKNESFINIELASLFDPFSDETKQFKKRPEVEIFTFMKYTIFNKGNMRLEPILFDVVESDIKLGRLNGTIEYTCLPYPTEEKKYLIDGRKNNTECPIIDVDPKKMRQYFQENWERIADKKGIILFTKIYP